jgi:toxin ParE1/3/4
LARVIWTNPALDDLRRIIDYISLDKPSAAKGYAKEVFSKVDDLELFPKKGKHPEELGRTHILEIVVRPSRIFYRIEGEECIILHVFRGEEPLDTDLLPYR